MPRYDWWVCIVLASPGIFVFIMNWAIYINNMRGKKWVSSIVLFGGVWIAVVCLLSPIKWLALIGFTDPGVWFLIIALFKELFPGTDKLVIVFNRWYKSQNLAKKPFTNI